MWWNIFDTYPFQWDSGNSSKSEIKHGVNSDEAESIFSDEDKIILVDTRHSIAEKRYLCIGRSNKGRILICAFTVREASIRIISIRQANKKEKDEYQNQ